MKDEPIPESSFNPFPEGSGTIPTFAHPWAQSRDTTLRPVADGNGPGGGLPAGDNPLGRSATMSEPNTLITFKEDE